MPRAAVEASDSFDAVDTLSRRKGSAVIALT